MWMIKNTPDVFRLQKSAEDRRQWNSFVQLCLLLFMGIWQTALRKFQVIRSSIRYVTATGEYDAEQKEVGAHGVTWYTSRSTKFSRSIKMWLKCCWKRPQRTTLRINFRSGSLLEWATNFQNYFSRTSVPSLLNTAMWSLKNLQWFSSISETKWSNFPALS